MSLIKKPSQLSVKPTMSALIYGQPGTGKSSLACSAPQPVMFDFDGGVNRINGAHQVPTVQPSSWEEALIAFGEVKQSSQFQTIIIDTVGKMLSYMDDYIKRTDPKKRKADGSLSLQGYGVRKSMFVNFIKEAQMLGKNIVFIAHEVEQKRGDETIIRPEIGGSSANDLMKELDLVGYMEMYGNKRTISFAPCEKYYAKNACNMPGVVEIPQTVDDNGDPIGENVFLSKVVRMYHDRLRKNLEQTAKFEELASKIHENASSIANAKDANDFVAWILSIDHIYNSKAVAQTALLKRVGELGLVYNKSTGEYSDSTSKDDDAPAA